METQKTQDKWMIDIVLFAGFIGLFWLDLTGVGLHQWLGVGIGGLAVYHLVTHWNWVKAVTERFFGRTSPKARLYYLVDAGLGLGFFMILFTGLAISTWFSLSLDNYAAWKNVHISSSIAALLLLVVKIGAHWRWIVQAARQTVFAPQVTATKIQPTQPAQVLASGRRDFMKLMGVVGAASFLAVGSALKEIDAADGSDVDSLDQSSAETSGLTWYEEESSAATNNANICQVKCPRGCSYPGHCHRYVDSNGNGRCDLGECA